MSWGRMGSDDLSLKQITQENRVVRAVRTGTRIFVCPTPSSDPILAWTTTARGSIMRAGRREASGPDHPVSGSRRVGARESCPAGGRGERAPTSVVAAGIDEWGAPSGRGDGACGVRYNPTTWPGRMGAIVGMNRLNDSCEQQWSHVESRSNRARSGRIGSSPRRPPGETRPCP